MGGSAAANPHSNPISGTIGMVRWLVGVALLWGCSSDPALELAVDLRSDYAPLADIDRVEVFLELGEGLERREEASLNGGENLLSGFRVAEYTDLPRGQFGLRLLAYRGGTTLVTRRANVDLRDSLAMTVVVSRSCEGVSCPQSGDPEIATECIGGTRVFSREPQFVLGLMHDRRGLSLAGLRHRTLHRHGVLSRSRQQRVRIR